jgi:hypothetical protein
MWNLSRVFIILPFTVIRNISMISSIGANNFLQQKLDTSYHR